MAAIEQTAPSLQQGAEVFGPSLENLSLSMVGVHMLFGDIDVNSSHACAEFLLKANMVLDDGFPLTLFINSGGGSVTDGWAIIDIMDMSRLPVSTVAIGEICSMGLLIFSAGTKGMRVITPQTLVMAHQFTAGTWGKQHELVAARKLHDHLEKQFLRHFLKHSNMSEKQIRDVLMSPSDRWLTPEECIKYGLADEIKGVWDESPVKVKVKRAPKSESQA